jgi:hypothetical protein
MMRRGPMAELLDSEGPCVSLKVSVYSNPMWRYLKLEASPEFRDIAEGLPDTEWVWPGHSNRSLRAINHTVNLSGMSHIAAYTCKSSRIEIL